MTDRAGLPARIELGPETLLTLHCLTDALLAMAAAYQRGGAVEIPKAARTGTMSPLPSTGEAPAPVVPVQPPSLAHRVPPAQAEPGGGSGHLDVSSLETTPPERLNEPPPAAAFSGNQGTAWSENAREIVRREWPAGTHVELVQKMLAEIGWHRSQKNIGIYAVCSLKVHRPEGFSPHLARAAMPPSPAPARQPIATKAPDPVTIQHTRNDVPSIAAIQLRDDFATLTHAPISLQDAVNWGVHNKIVQDPGEAMASLLDRIADCRRLHDLPPFRIIQPRALRPEPLPAPTSGDTNPNSYTKHRG